MDKFAGEKLARERVGVWKGAERMKKVCNKARWAGLMLGKELMHGEEASPES